MKSISRQCINVLVAFVVIFVLSIPISVLAEEEEEKDSYVGLDLNVMSLSVGGETYTPLNLRAKMGLVMFPDLIPVLAFEAHFGFSLTEATNTVDGNDIALNVGNYVGFYTRASYEVEDVVNLYGLLGLATAQLQGNTKTIGSDTQSGFSLGLGAGFSLPYDIDGNVEIMQLVSGKNFDIYMLSFGVSYKIM